MKSDKSSAPAEDSAQTATDQLNVQGDWGPLTENECLCDQSVPTYDWWCSSVNCCNENPTEAFVMDVSSTSV